VNRDDEGSHAAVDERTLSKADLDDIMPVEKVQRRPAVVQRRPPAEKESATLPSAIRALDAPKPEAIGWAVEGLILAGELALIAGEGGSFKSTVALHIAAAAAGGYPVFGRFRTEARPTLYVSEEDDAGILAHRLEAIVIGHGWDRARSLGNVHILARAGASFTDPTWQDHLLDEIARVDAGLVFLDPWCDLLGTLDEINVTPKKLCYEAPFGVGYLTVRYDIS
jgi:RecA-family ATPase